MGYKRSKSFKKFLDERDYLLVQFKQGDLTKRDFIALNLDLIDSMGLKPFLKIDCIEKGIYTYQYYNMMAKYTHLRARDEIKKGKHQKLAESLLKEAKEYYYQKDRTTYQFLRFLDFQHTRAYPIRVESAYLKGKLFEIVIEEPEHVIFHSTSLFLKDRLIEARVFEDKTKQSIVSDYVNQRY